MAQITSVEKQKRKNGRVNVYLDGEFFCGMQEIVAVKHGLKAGSEVSEQKLLMLAVESDKEQALNKVAHYLQYGPRTKDQLLKYLEKKGYSPEVVGFVLEKLENYNMLNDKNYAARYVAENSRRYGRRKLEFMLRQRGISSGDISEALEGFESEEEVVVSIAKKYLKNRPLSPELKQKLSQHLVGKGFNWGEIKTAIRHLEK